MRENIFYANVLKIVASIAVVLIHVCALKWYSIDQNTIKWQVLNIYNSISRWAVPIFVMVSGMLFLVPEKKINVQDIFLKYIKRILILIVFWELFYSVFIHIKSNEPLTINIVINNLISGHYHLPYLYFLIGLYLVTPIIKVIINANKKDIVKYFLILWCIFQIVINTIVSMLDIFTDRNVLSMLYSKLNITLILGYVGYYLLGYYLHTNEQTKKQRYIIYILGLISLVLTIVGTNCFDKNEVLYGYFSITTFFTAVALFVLVKQVFFKMKLKENLNLIIQKITKLTLGVYLIHPMYLILIEKLGINILSGNTFVIIPIITFIVYLLSIITSYLLSKIPIVGNYIV